MLTKEQEHKMRETCNRINARTRSIIDSAKSGDGEPHFTEAQVLELDDLCESFDAIANRLDADDIPENIAGKTSHGRKVRPGGLPTLGTSGDREITQWVDPNGKPGESWIHIGDDIRVCVGKTEGRKCKLGIDAPKDVRILRGSLVEPEQRVVERRTHNGLRTKPEHRRHRPERPDRDEWAEWWESEETHAAVASA